MSRHETLYQFRFCEPAPSKLRFYNWFEIDRLQIAARFGEVPALVENVGDAAAHARGKISAARSKHRNQALGHVFAAVVADSFDHCRRSGVANGKTLARHTVKKRFAAGSAIQGNVANQDVAFRGKC